MAKTPLTLGAMALSAALLAPVSTASAADSLSFNASVVSDYRYRGISQSRLKPAVQAGVDYALDSGFYVGAWASTIKWIEDTGTILGVDAGSTKAEVDLYGGYKFEVAKGVTLDVGGLYYLYAGNKLDAKVAGISAYKKADTFELYGAVSAGPFTVKYSHALTNTFGNLDSKNSGYLDVTANFDIGNGFTFTPHVGRQRISGTYSDVASYTDYSLGLSKEVVTGLTVTAAIVGTNARKDWYITPSGKFLGRSGGVLTLKYVF